MDRGRRRSEYGRKKATFKRAIRISKKSSWESFVRGNMNENAYGVAYKLGVRKIRPQLTYWSL